MMTTGGRSFCTIATAGGRALAITTSQTGKAQRYCERRPSSSSTISSLGFAAMAIRQADNAAASSATARRTDGQQQAHRRAARLAAEHEKIAARLAQQFARLIGADAVPAALRRGERSEQLVTDELGRHARPFVDDVDHDAQRLVA